MTKTHRLLFLSFIQASLDKRMGYYIGDQLYDPFMQIPTFDQFFRYRSQCLCGQPLVTAFPKGVTMDDEYTCMTGSHMETGDNGSVVKFLFNIDSRSVPYGDVSFVVASYVTSGAITIQGAMYNDPYRKPRMSIDEFIKKHFDQASQLKLKLNLIRTCKNAGIFCTTPRGYLCNYSYHQKTRPLTFNVRTKMMDPIELEEESFHIDLDKKNHHSQRIYFRTNYMESLSKIIVMAPSKTMVLGKEPVIEMPAEKFLGFPVNPEFLLNKAKTLLLFS